MGIVVPSGRKAIPQPKGIELPAKSKSTSPADAADTDAIRARAYLLWEADGRPEGRAEHYWRLAQAAAAPAKVKRASGAKTAAAAPGKKPSKKAKAS
jgi:hypothetical protein